MWWPKQGEQSWQSRLQKSVALSTIEAKYMVAVEANKELIWMKTFLSELGMKQEKFLLVYDNESVIHLAKNVAYHSRTKHIQRRYHWLWEKVDDGEFALVKIHTNDNGSDMLTKNLPMDRRGVCRQRTSLVDSFPQEWRGSFLGICPSCGRSQQSKTRKSRSEDQNWLTTIIGLGRKKK